MSGQGKMLYIYIYIYIYIYVAYIGQGGATSSEAVPHHSLRVKGAWTRPWSIVMKESKSGTERSHVGAPRSQDSAPSSSQDSAPWSQDWKGGGSYLVSLLHWLDDCNHHRWKNLCSMYCAWTFWFVH